MVEVKEVINTLYDARKGRSDCGESTTFRQRRQHRLPEKLSNPVCLRRSLVIFDKNCRLRTQILFLFTMLIKENIFSNKAQSTIRHTFTKEKNYRIKGGTDHLGPPLNPPVGIPMFYTLVTRIKDMIKHNKTN